MGSKDQAIQVLTEQGVQAAVASLLNDSDPAGSVNALNELMRHAFHQLKNLEMSLDIAKEGINYGETQAAQSQESEVVYAIRSQIKALHYNIASFTWPGWDDEKIEITETQTKLGFGSAQSNLAMAAELKKGNLPLSRAHWVVGAHQMAAGDLVSAKTNFEEAVKFAQKAKETPDELLSQGYILVVGLIDNPEDATALKHFADVKEKFSGIEYAEFFIEQLESALRVFSS